MLTNCLQDLSRIGTVLIPAFTFSAANAGSYDDRNSLPETGKLGLIARESCQFDRTPHRMFSYFVGGRDSDQYMNARYDSAFGKGTAIELTAREDVLVVMLAASWSSCTTIHAIEEELTVPYRENKRFEYPAHIKGKLQKGHMDTFVRKRLPRVRTH